jgi:hypothetical protein
MKKRKKRQQVETQAQTVLTLGPDLTTEFVYHLNGPLGEGNIQQSNSECA